MTDFILSASSAESVEQKYSDIAARIKQLEDLSGEDLASQMRQLKKALMENPEACKLMQPEDIGLMVANLRRITGQAAVAAAAKPKKGAAKPKALSAEELQNAFDEL